MKGRYLILIHAAVRGYGGDIEAVPIRPDEKRIILLCFTMVVGECTKYILGEDGFRVL